MPQSVTCACGQKLKAPDTLAGKTVKCPKCKQPLQVPSIPPAVEIDLRADSSLSSGLDDLLQQEMPTSSNAPLGSSPVFTSSASQSDGIPKWMLWAGGGITAVVLLGIVISVVVSSVGNANKQAALAEADVEQGPGSDEVKETDLSTAFTETVRPEQRKESSVPSAEPEAQQRLVLTQEDNIPSDSENYADQVAAPRETSDELDEKTLQLLRDQIQNSKVNLSPELGIDPQIEADIRDAFDKLAAAYRRDVLDAFEEIVDEQRLVDTVIKVYEKEREALSGEDIESIRASMIADSSMASDLKSDISYLDFTQYHLQLIELSPNKKTAAVIIYLRSKKFSSEKMKYWLCRNASEWKFFDSERLSVALRTSRIISDEVGSPDELKARLPEENAISALRDAQKSNDSAVIERALDRLDMVAKQKLSHYIRHRSRAVWLYDYKDDFRQSLFHAELAHAAKPDSPQLFLDRAQCYVQLREYVKAIPMCLAYQKRVGPDEEFWRQIAKALYGLGYAEEGIGAWERCLEFDPEYLAAVYELANVFLPEHPDRIKPHVSKELFDDESFSVIIDWLEEKDHLEVRDALLKVREEN